MRHAHLRSTALLRRALLVESTLVAADPPPDIREDERTEYIATLLKLVEADRDQARRLKLKAEEGDEYVQGETWRMKRWKYNTLLRMIQNRGIRISEDEMRSLLLDEDWTEPEHADWLLNAGTEEILSWLRHVADA